MKFLVLADLHFDFWKNVGRNPFEGMEQALSELDLLILAGDISNKPKVRWPQAFAFLADMIDPDRIHVFPGNHDFYDFRLDGEDRLAQIAQTHGVHYANRCVITLGKVRFLCATLWTDCGIGGHRMANEAAIASGMNDYRYIRIASDHYRRAQPTDTVSRHFQDRAWIEAQLQAPFDGQSFVVTHHAPLPETLEGASGRNPDLDAAYASDMRDFINAGSPDEWMFGHIHDGHSAQAGCTRVHNVSLGYPDQVADPGARIRSLIRTA